MKTLFTWIGQTDLNAAKSADEFGPIAQAVGDRDFDHIVLFYNYSEEEVQHFFPWLAQLTSTQTSKFKADLTSPTNYGEIYSFVKAHIEEFQSPNPNAKLTFHLSPGTPAMAAVWLLLAKTIFPATLIEASRESGVRDADVPFEIHADFLPKTLRQYGNFLEGKMQLPPNESEFDNIIYKSELMTRVISRARKVAMTSISVLIEGESGTGKELLAKAIHNGSPRKAEPFIPVNCGAISSDLIESEFFGHVKGAFTGADRDKDGYFRAANKGTLFLDEIGDLPKSAQVKLLRVLQEGEVTPVGASEPIKIDVRVISATHKNLIQEVALHHFREDLFYRLAVAILNLPPLRDRQHDLGQLIDHCLGLIEPEPKKRKKVSVGARKLLTNHPWPGNIRELHNTLQRASLWSAEDQITEEDIEDAFLSVARQTTPILNRPLHKGVDLSKILAEVDQHYLERAWKQSGGVKKIAAKLLGLNNATTFTNRFKNYDL